MSAVASAALCTGEVSKQGVASKEQSLSPRPLGSQPCGSGSELRGAAVFPGSAVPSAEMQLILPGLHSCWTGRAGSRWLAQ